MAISSAASTAAPAPTNEAAWVSPPLRAAMTASPREAASNAAEANHHQRPERY